LNKRTSKELSKHCRLKTNKDFGWFLFLTNLQKIPLKLSIQNIFISINYNQKDKPLNNKKIVILLLYSEQTFRMKWIIENERLVLKLLLLETYLYEIIRDTKYSTCRALFPLIWGRNPLPISLLAPFYLSFLEQFTQTLLLKIVWVFKNPFGFILNAEKFFEWYFFKKIKLKTNLQKVV
jgi:hypothetical protein